VSSAVCGGAKKLWDFQKVMLLLTVSE